MTSNPDISLLVSTYQRPQNLALCLLSIARQQGVDGRLELVVTDDGSRDETAQVVKRFAHDAPFPVGFTTHEHDGFQLSRCRNEGVRASRAPYLLFLDGDCILPPDHVRIHLEQRRAGTVNGSDCLRLPAEQSQLVDADVVGRGSAPRGVPLGERWRVWRDHLEAELNGLLRNPSRPKLFGNNIALWREDLERINGFDQRFRHWGGEDDDLRLRLRQQGLTVRSIRHLTRICHLWHPPTPSAPRRWSEGRNVAYLRRDFRLSRCRQGLIERRPQELAIQVVDGGRHVAKTAEWLPFARPHAGDRDPEVEFLFLPGGGEFSGRAECNVLVLLERVRRPPLARAHILISDLADRQFDPALHLPLERFDEVWELF
jgi:glycosyltransferase involved in cell wall biosynthesis